jgi:hypothetical protein
MTVDRWLSLLIAVDVSVAVAYCRCVPARPPQRFGAALRLVSAGRRSFVCAFGVLPSPLQA